MSVASEITRLQGVKREIMDALSAKGVTVPQGAALADVPELIGDIPGGGELPDEYKRLLFIAKAAGASTTVNFPSNTFYIDSSDTIILKFANQRINTSQFYFTVIRAYNSSLNKLIQFYIDEASSKNRYNGQWGTLYYGIATSNVDCYTYQDYEVVMKSTEQIKINGVSYNWNREQIGAYINQISSNQGNFSKYYSIQIKDSSDGIKFNFVPCVRIADSVPGLFEEKTQTFVDFTGWTPGIDA